MKLDIKGVHFELNDKITEYVTKKITGLDKYISRKDQKSDGVLAKVILSEDQSGREGTRFVCEVIMNLPGHPTLQAKDGTLNIYAAVDIVEAKLKAQLLKVKDKHNPRSQQGRKWYAKLLGRKQE